MGRSAHSGVSEGEWAVFASKQTERAEEAEAKLSEALANVAKLQEALGRLIEEVRWLDVSFIDDDDEAEAEAMFERAQAVLDSTNPAVAPDGEEPNGATQDVTNE